MSEQDKSLLDEQAALVRAVYRALPEEEIPAEIERRILAHAATAIEPTHPRRWLQWSGPLASAAVVLLVVGVVMQPQSQREMVPELPISASMIDVQQDAPPRMASAPTAEPAPRMAAEKPDLSARPKAFEDARVPSSAQPAPVQSAITTVMTMPPATAELLLKSEESASAAFQPPTVLAEERKQQEADLPLTRAPAEAMGGMSGAADASISASKRLSAADSRRSGLMRAAPAAAPLAANPVNPALNISPELRAQLEKFLSARAKNNASADEPTLEQLRRDYPGVDIDAALEALEQMR